jgi:signal transduction histidine kinase
LFFVKKVAEQHDLSIEVESTPGQGSCFTFIWPASAQVAFESED